MDDDKRVVENRKKEHFDSDSMKPDSAVDIDHEDNAVGVKEKIIPSENERCERPRSFSEDEILLRDFVSGVELSSATVDILERKNFKTIKDLNLLDSANIQRLNLPFLDQLRLLKLVNTLKTKERQADQTSNTYSEICSSAQQRKEEANIQHFELDGRTFRYEIVGSAIGSGGYADVFKARVDGKIFSKSINDYTDTLVIKLLKNCTKSEEEFQKNLHETEERTKYLQSIPHRNLIELFGVHTYKSDTNGNRVAIIMEYCSGGTLEDVVTRKREPEFWQNIAYLRQIVFVLAHLYQHDIVHGDLKPANILINKCAQTGEEIIKLADVDDVIVLRGDVMVAGEGNFKGSVQYSSPEMAENYSNTQSESELKIGWKTDVWSFGNIALDVLFGYKKRIIKTDTQKLKIHQSKDNNEIIRILGLGGVPSSEKGDIFIPRKVAVKDLLKGCFEKNPKDRWAADKLLTLPWLYSTGHCQMFEKNMQIYMQSPDDTVEDPLELYYRKTPTLYYRDVKLIFNQFMETKPNFVSGLRVTIYRQVQLIDLFSGVNDMIEGLEFHAAHGWTSAVMRRVNLPHLRLISFSQCQDISFKKGDWQSLPNLEEIRFDEDSSILEMEDNFLLELPNLRIFHIIDQLGNNGLPSASQIRTLQLLQSPHYEWFHRYIKRKDEESGTSFQSGIKTNIEPSDLTKLGALLTDLLITEDTKSCLQLNQLIQSEVWDEWEKFHSMKSIFPGPRDKLYCTTNESALLNQTEFRLKDLLDCWELIEKNLQCLQEGPVRLEVHADRSSSWNRDFGQLFPRLLNQFKWQIVSLTIYHACIPHLKFEIFLENFYLPYLVELKFIDCDTIEVTRKGLMGFPKLRALIMEATTVSCIEKEVFRQLPDLKYLALDYKIHQYPELASSHLERFHQSDDYEWLREKFRLEPTLIGKKFRGEVWEFKSSKHYICSEAFGSNDAFLNYDGFLNHVNPKRQKRQQQKNMPPFEMGKFTKNEISKALHVEPVVGIYGEYMIFYFFGSCERTRLLIWTWSINNPGWLIQISSADASEQNLLVEHFSNLMRLGKHHPLCVEINAEKGISSETVKALQVLGEDIVLLYVLNGNNFELGQLFGDLRLPNLLDLWFLHCTDMIMDKHCFDAFPSIRRLKVLCAELPKMQDNIFKESPTLQSIDISFPDYAKDWLNEADLLWLNIYFEENPALTAEVHSGEVWSFESNGYRYLSPISYHYHPLLYAEDEVGGRKPQRNIPPFRMEKYTWDEIAMALNVEGVSRKGCCGGSITFKLTENDEHTVLWMAEGSSHPWEIRISPNLASSSNAVCVLDKSLRNLLSLQKNQPICVRINIKHGISISTIQALSILGENIIELCIIDGENIAFNENLAKLEFSNLLNLELLNCTNVTLRMGCFNGFPNMRRFAVVAGELPKMENNIFKKSFTLQSIELHTGAETVPWIELEDLVWLKEYVYANLHLVEPQFRGQVWEFKKNEYHYYSTSTTASMQIARTIFLSENQKNKPLFRMEVFTMDEVATALNVQPRKRLVGTNEVTTFDLTPSDENTFLWIDDVDWLWTIQISSSVASNSSPANLLIKPLENLKNLGKNHPIQIEIDMKEGVSDETVHALSMLRDEIIWLDLTNGENIVFNQSFGRLELPNLLDLFCTECSDIIMLDGCFDTFPSMRRFTIDGGRFPKMEKNIFERKSTLQSIEFRKVADMAILQESEDLLWLREYLNKNPGLAEPKVPGQVWKFEKNGYSYESVPT